MIGGCFFSPHPAIVNPTHIQTLSTMPLLDPHASAHRPHAILITMVVIAVMRIAVVVVVVVGEIVVETTRDQQRYLPTHSLLSQ